MNKWCKNAVNYKPCFVAQDCLGHHRYPLESGSDLDLIVCSIWIDEPTLHPTAHRRVKKLVFQGSGGPSLTGWPKWLYCMSKLHGLKMAPLPPLRLVRGTHGQEIFKGLPLSSPLLPLAWAAPLLNEYADPPLKPGTVWIRFCKDSKVLSWLCRSADGKQRWGEDLDTVVSVTLTINDHGYYLQRIQ
ncbi:protein ORF41 [Anguillid herpesvirus 1]|uniref:Protein ORF41 n=1 Tax=Anguillid herpesvirus 1 TaxID=150286 RepID=A0A1J0REG5_9VIRU|nr:protein ORF41 [Anguillid herpesvirus 1]ADA57804.1 protein ORF41 [Anguillid herpesvirus 1]APD76204.1 ORF41 [Anguillid herpesvirus 1]QRM16334.1 protein ORF41 [Anguillid herpesvirus 1]QRM16464.1 protein ORF41 [Anguillid herpesvirus 1]QRM16593.1 protein ORF41 [Anguillid herpesvirus 1]